MLLVFRGLDPVRHSLIHTLFYQQLLKNNLLTFNGIMLPSYAHRDRELRETLRAFRQSLTVVKQAIDTETIVPLLEIPETNTHNQSLFLLAG